MQWVPGALSLEVKRPVPEADHPPPPSAEVKNGGAIPPLPIHPRALVINYLSTGSKLLLSLREVYCCLYTVLGWGTR
jgi:hypothetical protein